MNKNIKTITLKRHFLQIYITEKRVLLFLALFSFISPPYLEEIQYLKILFYGLKFVTVVLFLGIRGYKLTIPNKNNDLNKYGVMIAIILLAFFESLSNFIKTVNLLSIRYIILYIGFAQILLDESQKNPDMLIEEMTKLLWSYHFIQLITILLFYPYGINDYHSPLGTEYDLSGAAYFFGGKNQMLSYMLLFLLCNHFNCIIHQGKISKRSYVYLLIFICEAYFLDSFASIFCLILIGGVLFITDTKILRKIWRMFNPYFLLLLLLIIFIICCINIPLLTTSKNSDFLAVFLGNVGRDITFTGRTFIWNEAINMIKNNVFFGGNGVYHVYRDVYVDQAHNAYYDIFSKYGIFSFASFILLLFQTAGVLTKFKSDKSIYIFCSLVFFIFLVHKCFEFLNIYIFFAMIFVYIASSNIMENNSNGCVEFLKGKESRCF